MTSKFRYCRQCGARFEYTRDDQQFCSPKCVAAFYRDNPNPEYIHAANMDEYWHVCEWCGVAFFVNGYAERGGKRAPKYHSNSCKQAAYRARGKATQEQAARRNNQSAHSAPPPPPPPPPPPQGNTRGGVHGFKYVGTSKQSAAAVSEALKILGLSSLVTPYELKKAYIAMISHWHPDRNPDPDANEWSKAINWAYDYLKY